MRSHFHTAPSVSMSDLSDFVSYVTGRKIWTANEINSIDDEFGMDGEPVWVRTESGEVADLNAGEVECIYGAGWAITGFRKA